MNTQKVQVKVFAGEPSGVDSEALIPVFHRWIREAVVHDELMIDVADYSHVADGPGVVLVGHGVDYYYDLGQGGPGLLVSRKRALDGDFRAAVVDAFERALEACHVLSTEDGLGRLAFGTEALLFRVQDRLAAPNTDESFAAVEPTLRAVLDRLFDGGAFALERVGTAREALTVRITAEAAPSVEAAIGRLRRA